MNAEKQTEIRRDSFTQDAKDLLTASGRLLTGLFRRGLCSARAAGARWRSFADSLAQSVELLKKPSFIAGEDAPRPDLDPLSEPMVTVVESADRRFPLGSRMPLSRADALIKQLDQEGQSAGQKPQKLQVVIDYTMDGLPDRYRAEVSLGEGGGSLVEQIKAHVDAYRLDAERTARLLEGVPPEVRAAHVVGLQEDMDRTATQLVSFLQCHCDLSRMEANFGVPQTVAPGEDIEYKVDNIMSDPKVVGILATGYPHNTLEAMDLDNKYQAFYATKMALWCYLISSWSIDKLTINPDLTGSERNVAERILTAARKAYINGTQWTQVPQPSITTAADREKAYPVTIDGKEYLQQVFSVHSETWVGDLSIIMYSVGRKDGKDFVRAEFQVSGVTKAFVEYRVPSGEMFKDIKDGKTGKPKLSFIRFMSLIPIDNRGDHDDNLDYDDVLARIGILLGADMGGDTLTKWQRSGYEYRLSGLDVEIVNTPLTPGNTNKNFEADARITIEIPLSFGWGMVPPLQMEVRTRAAYMPKF